MSLIRGVMLAGKFRSQHQLNTMSHDDMRNTLIVEIAGRSKQTGLQAFDDDTLAGMGAVLVFLRTAHIRDDAALKGMTSDDMRNVLIVELGAQTGMNGPALQAMSNIELVKLGLGKPQPGGLNAATYIRGVLLAGQFSTQHLLDKMSSDDMRNTLIFEMAAHSNQTNYQAFSDFQLAGVGAVMVFLREASLRTDAELKAMSADEQRNVAIVEIGSQTNLGSKLQGLSNMDLVLTALGVDPVFKCDPLRNQLSALEEELRKTKKFDPPAEPGDKPTISEAFQNVSNRVSQARFKLNTCIASLHLPTPPPPPPVPLTLTLMTFACLDQSDDIRPPPFFLNVEDDEPYALVFAVDLKLGVGGIPVGATNSKMTLVGPLRDVDIETLAAPPNVIWGLSNAPDLVSSANNLIVLVAMMENDSSSPDQVRSGLEAAGQLSMGQSLPAFIAQQIPRQELVRRMIAGMAGAMGVAKVGFPDPDDNIGAIQELQFFQFELDDIYKSSISVEKSLVFEGDDAKYVLKFKLFR